jgi:hypothetical protein
MDTTRMRIMTLSRGNRSITVREVNCDYIMWPSPQSWPRGTICGLGGLGPGRPSGVCEIFFDPPGSGRLRDWPPSVGFDK